MHHCAPPKAILVTFRVEGFHRWPTAPPHRDYLAHRHRHLFHVDARLAVQHHDREVEFHDLLDQCRAQLPPGEYGTQSCEDLADRLCTWLAATYPGRAITVRVWEDGECGAEVSTP